MQRTHACTTDCENPSLTTCNQILIIRLIHKVVLTFSRDPMHETSYSTNTRCASCPHPVLRNPDLRGGWSLLFFTDIKTLLTNIIIITHTATNSRIHTAYCTNLHLAEGTKHARRFPPKLHGHSLLTTST